MKSLYLALAFSCFATVSLAQKSFILHYQPKLGFVTVSAGVSLPTGDFGSLSASSKQAGLATTGNVISVAAGYRLAGVIGLMGRYQQQTNGMDASALLTLPSIEQTNGRWATADQWTVTSALAGPYISLPVGRFSLDLRALAGPASAVCPATRIGGENGDVSVLVSTSQGKANTTAYSGGLTLTYRLGRCLAAQLNSDYTTARFDFTGMTTTMQAGNRSQTIAVEGQKKISALTVSAGLTFLFGNRFRPF